MNGENASYYDLVLSFDNLFQTMPEERAFVHGVEFGGLWHRMVLGAEAEIQATTHTENREVIARAAAAKGWTAESNPSGIEGWDFTKLCKVRAEQPNPHGLRVVK